MSRPSFYPGRTAGFTLIELMVALGIFMVLGILSYRALASIVDSRDRVSIQQQHWQSITRFVQRIELDLQQIPLDQPDALVVDADGRSLHLLRLIPNAVGDEVTTVHYRWHADRIERQERKGRNQFDTDPKGAWEVALASVSDIEWQWPVATPEAGGEMLWQAPPSARNSVPPAAIRLRFRVEQTAGDIFRVMALR